MKDLIQEGRKIQETFKKNVIQESNILNEEESFLSKVKKFIIGRDLIEISLFFDIEDKSVYDGSFEKTNNLREKSEEIVRKSCDKILKTKYGFESSYINYGDSSHLSLVRFYYIEIDSSNKNEYSDSNIKKMVDECISEISKIKNIPDGLKVKLRANLFHRNKLVKKIYDKSYEVQSQTKIEF
jgi:hypothetical protein